MDRDFTLRIQHGFRWITLCCALHHLFSLRACHSHTLHSAITPVEPLHTSITLPYLAAGFCLLVLRLRAPDTACLRFCLRSPPPPCHHWVRRHHTHSTLCTAWTTYTLCLDTPPPACCTARFYTLFCTGYVLPPQHASPPLHRVHVLCCRAFHLSPFY